MEREWSEIRNKNGTLFTFNCPTQFPSCERVALFDLDNTIIKFCKDILVCSRACILNDR